jgi:hypothetical protein
MGIFDFLSAGAAGVGGNLLAGGDGGGLAGLGGLMGGIGPGGVLGNEVLGRKKKLGIGDIFGILGDSLLAGNDAEPIYAKRKQDEQIAAAAGLLNDPNTENEGLRQIFGIDSKTGVQVQKNLLDARAAREKAAADAAKAQEEAMTLGRTQALNQLYAGVPRNIVEAAAAKKGIDISDIPTDPAQLKAYGRGSLGIDKQALIEDRADDNQRDRAYKEGQLSLGAGRLKVNAALGAGRLTAGTNIQGGRLTKPSGKGSSTKPSSSSSGPMMKVIESGPQKGTIVYRQPDGSYKPK